jgi:Sec-independent protein translocase protein TatA
MWTEILGALAIVAIVFVGQVVIPAAPKLVDAAADRIRYGVQDPAQADEEETEQPPATLADAATQQIATTAAQQASATKAAAAPAQRTAAAA